MLVQEYMYRAGVGFKFLSANLNNTAFFGSVNITNEATQRYVKVYSIAKKIVEDRKLGVFIEGIPGSGKSFLGAAIIREFLRSGVKAARATMDEIKDHYYDDFKGLRERHIQAEVLLIEDITGNGVGSAQYPQVLEKLVKIRDDEKLITLYTALPGGISKKYSEAVVRIIKGTTITLQLPEIDFRQVMVTSYADGLK